MENSAWIETLWGINVKTHRQGVREVEKEEKEQQREKGGESEMGEKERARKRGERERGG